MELTVFDSNLESIGIIDEFKSLIWTDRYYGAGDFELVKMPSSSFFNLINSGSYLGLEESEHLMVIEYVNLKSDADNGNEVIVKGRSLESILARRIIWDPTVLTGNFQEKVIYLVEINTVSSPDVPRRISRLETGISVDPIVTALTIDSQFGGEYLYDAVVNLCMSRGVGFKIALTAANNFRFLLYAGVDRSYDQFANPTIVFSPRYENLLNGDYIYSDQLLRTVSLVAGEKGVGNARLMVTVDPSGGTLTDLDRRELYVDAQGITRSLPDGTTLTDEEYTLQLVQKGLEELSNNTNIEIFEGQVDATMLVYGVDYFMGDILQVADEYGHEAKSRVIELIRSQDQSGTKVVPTFSIP